VSGDPTGLAVALNGVAVGKTPLTLRELKPGPYTLTATDGENERDADITVGPKEQARHSFAFRYGAVQLTSMPAGATVIRKGKEIGTTPLTLAHLARGRQRGRRAAVKWLCSHGGLCARCGGRG